MRPCARQGMGAEREVLTFMNFMTFMVELCFKRGAAGAAFGFPFKLFMSFMVMLFLVFIRVHPWFI